ncbi:Smr/MutS family protein [Pollutimonas sp. M17]|uniref:Smr/MutS family protein n=1 Tax=Pollutimonas sp. M17 TaxID=2962065 RepID=UPI0021F411EE|nr:Smr/MutS family protein [Pollutimonas sp. M17]UYO92776.1 Smr/MutS family protein [Pollutimonas sp. M17]
MRANKNGRSGQPAHGLADLKRLRKAAAQAAATPDTAPPAGTKATKTAKTAKAVEPALSRDDALLFRRAMKTVEPIKAARRTLLPVQRPVAAGDILRQRRERATGLDPVRLPQTSDHYSPATADGDDSRYLRMGHGPDLIKGLQRGKWPVSASLDLHGSTLEQARERLDRFLESCMAHRIKCVRIVHGKGYGSKDGASVLKQTIRRWLTQIDGVAAYAECSERDGGAGAVHVLLRTDAASP